MTVNTFSRLKALRRRALPATVILCGLGSAQ